MPNLVFRSDYEKLFFEQILNAIIYKGFARYVKYEEAVWYLSEAGDKRPIHPDFVIHGKTDQIKLAIEIDGKQHQHTDRIINDLMRDDTLKSLGYVVVRFSTHDLRHHLSGCILKIKTILESQETQSIESAQARKLFQLREKGML